MTGPLRILHIFRSPLGGLFRHVCDLVREQTAQGHLVGIVCDNSTGGPQAEVKLEQIEHLCGLGVLRIPMSRKIGLNDIHAPVHVSRWALETHADILHGHGAKGGAYARLSKKPEGSTCFYTPHGGSLHYSSNSPMGMIYLNLEKMLASKTDGFIFESRFSKDAFAEKVGVFKKPARVIHNGLRGDEFRPVVLTKNPADFVFVGELRDLKGLDELLVAMKSLNEKKKVSLVVAGSGPDEAKFKKLVSEFGLENQITFIGFTPAREAFSKGRVMVMPSRAESFPYIVLEALAAKKPLISTNVGGIPEIYGDQARHLIPPCDGERLAKAMRQALNRPQDIKKRTTALHKHVKSEFTIGHMASDLLNFYLACGAQCSSQENISKLSA